MNSKLANMIIPKGFEDKDTEEANAQMKSHFDKIQEKIMAERAAAKEKESK